MGDPLTTKDRTMRSLRSLLLRVGVVLVAVLALLLVESWKAAEGNGDKLTRPVAVSVTPYAQHDVTVDGMRLRYVEEGSGPILVLIPGLTSRIEEYDGMVADLRRDFRVLALDFPGSGYSDKPVREYDVQFYVRTLDHFLDALHVERAFLAGGSLGGNIVLRAGAADPHRYPRLVAWGSGGAWEPIPLGAWLARTFGGQTTFWPTVKIQSRYWYRKEFPRSASCLDDTFAYYHEALSPGFIRMYWGLFADQAGSSLFPLAPSISQPTLLLWGDHDEGVNMGEGERRLQSLMPHARLTVMKDCGHALATERPHETAAAVAAFLHEP